MLGQISSQDVSAQKGAKANRGTLSQIGLVGEGEGEEDVIEEPPTAKLGQ